MGIRPGVRGVGAARFKVVALRRISVEMTDSEAERDDSDENAETDPSTHAEDTAGSNPSESPICNDDRQPVEKEPVDGASATPPHEPMGDEPSGEPDDPRADEPITSLTADADDASVAADGDEAAADADDPAADADDTAADGDNGPSDSPPENILRVTEPFQGSHVTEPFQGLRGTEPFHDSRTSSPPQADGLRDLSDPFCILGDAVRMSVLRELAAADAEGDGIRSFSELFDASNADTTVEFASHLRQLVGLYVTKRAETYELTPAGLKLTRAIAGNPAPDSVDYEPVTVPDPCPFCAAETLALNMTDSYASVSCRTCERVLLKLPSSPGGHRANGDDLLSAFDSYQRHRIAQMADGVCPNCAASIEQSVERPAEDRKNRLPDNPEERLQLAMSCDECGYQLRCPVTLSVLTYPEVISFYHDHGENVRDRPLWSVGAEWRESIVSEDPWCALVSTRLDDDVLDLFLDAAGTVIASRRSELE